jgi:hypothetical protein
MLVLTIFVGLFIMSEGSFMEEAVGGFFAQVLIDLITNILYPVRYEGYCGVGTSLQVFPAVDGECSAEEFVRTYRESPGLVVSMGVFILVISGICSMIRICLFGTREEREDFAGYCLGACLYRMLDDDD